ncbi:MAG: 3D domain-containing protein [Peptoniphilus grossensis]|uniref:3D domain-containing protein n=1 Tax=Peptoniphilus grossensis TaxID=1465756 RepID=UPI00290D3DFB|nr:3D domain-containing protein [Peptoniphilus grossensis]MDU7151065.1 3D domain-containing protein [Peptoniphilus grossensis]
MNRKNIFRNAKFILIVLALVSVLTMGFSTALGNDVELNINGKTKTVFTYEKTVGDFLEKEGIVLKNKDLVSPSLDKVIDKDMKIVISSPKSYHIKDGKKTLIAEASGYTVADVLDNLDIKLNKLDRVSLPLDEIAKEGMEIKIDRVVVENLENKIEIPFETESRENKDMFEGEKKVITNGEVGQKTESLKNTYVNGVLETTEVLKSEITKDPVKEVVEVGTKKGTVAPNGKNAKRVIVMQATAYDLTAGSKTAMGTRARVGAVAVDPKVIPLGSKLYIESMDGFASYGYATAEDTGGAIKGNRIDLFYNSNAEANRFGRRNVKVYVLD